MRMSAGAAKRPPATGLVSVTTGGRLTGAERDTMVTLSKIDVATRVGSWLVTAKPTYTVSAIGTVSRPNESHARPSIDRNASSDEPDRTSRIHAGRGLAPPLVLSL